MTIFVGEASLLLYSSQDIILVSASFQSRQAIVTAIFSNLTELGNRKHPKDENKLLDHTIGHTKPPGLLGYGGCPHHNPQCKDLS